LTQARTGNTSLRQRARLTDDARPLPRQSHVPVTPAPEAPKPDIPAVVPAAFTVPVETGSVLEQTPDKTPDIDSAPLKPAAEKPPTQPLPRRDEPPDVGSPGDTARIHIAHATTSTPPPTAAIEPVKPADSRQKSEFVLANGERIFGHILSETPQTIYLDHGTLGVLTLPRSQIAAKPIEVILINGDRLVGDLIAETPECLYLKHASLGMVTVPHGQRSTRVVEAILKDGDRILGEVLAETDNFTVIRSATLGTVAVQHDQVAMLNRKIEQMQLRALPTSTSPALENKKDQPPL
jgi:RNase P/RNase MRP subunit p29